MPPVDVNLESPFSSGAVATIDQESAPAGAFLMVEDENGRPLGGAQYSFRQELVTSQGTLDGGKALFGKIDPSKPFYFSVRDRVCAIRFGAYIDPDKQHVQYGGTWFDWTVVRDATAKAAQFWPRYQRQMDTAEKRYSVDRFWQHEHITRREIQITKECQKKLEQVRIRAVPSRIRVGPFVRYTDHERAVIWLETLTPCLVKVCYRLPGAKPDFRVAPTVRVGGRHYGFVEISGLSEAKFHEYTVELAPLPHGPLPHTPEQCAAAFPTLGAVVLACQKKDLTDVSIGGNEWLTFRTLCAKYTRELRFVTGSCRWYPDDKKGGKDHGPDMLREYGTWLKRAPKASWPDFAFYSGDQIYSDECGDDHAQRLREGRFAARAPGPSTPGTPRSQLLDGAWAGRFAHRYRKNASSPKLLAMLKSRVDQFDAIHKRHPEIRDLVRYNAGIPPKNRDRRVQLALGGHNRKDQAEFWATLQKLKQLEINTKPLIPHYQHWQAAEGVPEGRTELLAHNFLLWEVPVNEGDLPTIKDNGTMPVARGAEERAHSPADGGVHAADYAEYASHYERAWTSHPDVRRLLAHLPTFLVFDDHELTDDWNFDVSWVRMLHNPKDDFGMWPKTLTDALAAYWVYQGYGNRAPSKWNAQDPRVAALRNAAAQGIDALPALRECIFRACYANPPKPGAKTHQSGTSLDWHYQLPFEPAFLVLDGRSRKRLVAAEEGLRTIEHGSSKAPQSQTLDDAQRAWLEGLLSGVRGPIAFLAPPTPVLIQRKVMDLMQRPETVAALWAGDWTQFPAGRLDSTKLGMADDALLRVFRRSKDLEHIIRDRTWRDLWQYVESLAKKKSGLKTLVLISGDVHHSYCMSAAVRGDPQPGPELLQITCSGLQSTIREDFGTKQGEKLGRDAFDIGNVRLKPGFLSKNGQGSPDLALFVNSIATVHASWDQQVRVRVEFFAGADRHIFQYASQPAVAKPTRELEGVV
jgi:hypothetical protein